MLTNELTTITTTTLEHVRGGNNPVSRVFEKTFDTAGKGGVTGAGFGAAVGRAGRFPSDSGNPLEKLPEYVGAGVGGVIGTAIGGAWGLGVAIGNEVNRAIGQEPVL